MNNQPSAGKYAAYIGTYGGGIHVFRYNCGSGAMEPDSVAEIENPSYLCPSRCGRFLYAVSETGECDAGYGGTVAAFAVDGATGRLALVNRQPTAGRWPCHLTVDESSRMLFAANYGDGTVAVFSLNDDGSISPRRALLRHEGSGPNRERQEGPHAHFVTPGPGGKYLYAVDLGADAVFAYAIGHGGLPAADEAATLRLQPGAGPRHMAFHPDRRFAYLLTELGCEVQVFRYSMADGLLGLLQAVSALPQDFHGENLCAAIRVSADGRMLYAGNRGHDSIAAYTIDGGSGMLTLHSHVPAGGHWPRDIAIGPEGRYLFAANERSDTVTAFTIGGDGGLAPAGMAASVPKPVCIAFVQLQ